ncbi:hypothetical protein KAU08_11550 [bacterium]|nr:hypothetical protein [bacterium]
MKTLKGLFFILVIIIIAGILTPMDIRIAYWNYGFASILERTGDPGGAVDHYKLAFEAIPGDVKFIRAYAGMLNDNGDNFSDTNSFQSAFSVSNDWITEYEHHDQVWQIYIERARANWGRGRKPAAKGDIDIAVDLRPTDYTALVYQGIIWRDLQTNRDRIRESIPVFEQAIRVRNSRNTWWAHFELAKAWYMVNDEVRALNELNQALSQYPPRWLREEAERLKHDIQSSGRSNR